MVAPPVKLLRFGNNTRERIVEASKHLLNCFVGHSCFERLACTFDELTPNSDD